MSTLYRKYRPQLFADLIGQNHIRITLQNEIERNELGHAYLFCGPRGLGKTTTARLFAKAINCASRAEGQSEPCNVCQSCVEITGNRAGDVIEIDAASHTGVDNVRENIIENSRFSPSSSKYKVFIIDEVHMLSPAAFNALLKTLEEPPAHVIFILCTTEIHKIPATIISRCQRFDFRKVSADNMAKRLDSIVQLEEKKVDNEVIKKIVLYSDGCVRDAESLLGKILTLGDNIDLEQAELVLPRSEISNVVKLIGFIAEKNSTAGVEEINKLVEEGVDLSFFTESLLEYLRKVLLIKISGELGIFGIELDETSQQAAVEYAKKFSHQELVSMIEIFVKRAAEIKSAAIVQFPLELAVVELCESIVCRVDESSLGSGKQYFDNVAAKITGSAKTMQLAQEPVKKIVETPKSRPEETISDISESGETTDDQEIKAPEAVAVAPEKIDAVETNCVVDFERIKSSWQLIVGTILSKHYSLSSVLAMSQPRKCTGTMLDIAVASQFYKERLETANNQSLVENTIEEVLGFKVKVRGLVDASIAPKLSDPEPSPRSSAPSFTSAPAPEIQITSIEPAATVAESMAPIAPLPKGDAVAEVMSMF